MNTYRLREEISPVTLSPRMRDTFTMLAYGLNTKEIADALNISTKTVEYHKARLFLLFRFPDFATMVRTAVAFNIV